MAEWRTTLRGYILSRSLEIVSAGHVRIRCKTWCASQRGAFARRMDAETTLGMFNDEAISGTWLSGEQRLVDTS
jgi:hypothetical protein